MIETLKKSIPQNSVMLVIIAAVLCAWFFAGEFPIKSGKVIYLITAPSHGQGINESYDKGLKAKLYQNYLIMERQGGGATVVIPRDKIATVIFE